MITAGWIATQRKAHGLKATSRELPVYLTRDMAKAGTARSAAATHSSGREVAVTQTGGGTDKATCTRVTARIRDER